MANWYFHHAAAGANNGTDWTNAYTNLSSMSGKAAGDRFFVAHDHAQTQATALTLTSPGTEATPCQIYCVNRAGSVPPVSADLRTTATVTTTVANSISMAGSVSECYGIAFNCGSGSSIANIGVSTTASRTWRLNSCQLKLNSSGASCRINMGTTAGTNFSVLENCTVQFTSTSQQINVNGRVMIRGPSTTFVTGAVFPSTLFNPTNAPAMVTLEGVNLSSTTGSQITMSTTFNCIVMLKDCQVGSGANILTGAGIDAHVIRCDNADTNYRIARQVIGGTLVHETTIVRSGGASDGATPIAWKITTTAGGAVWSFESQPIMLWNESTSAITLTVEGIWGGGATPLNTEIWIDVFYLATSGTGMATRISSHPGTIIHAGTNLAAGSGTWGGSTTKFKMAVTFTPAEKGPITVYVKTRAASSTYYIDPKPVLT